MKKHPILVDSKGLRWAPCPWRASITSLAVPLRNGQGPNGRDIVTGPQLLLGVQKSSLAGGWLVRCCVGDAESRLEMEMEVGVGMEWKGQLRSHICLSCKLECMMHAGTSAEVCLPKVIAWLPR